MKFATKTMRYYPPHLRHVATLPSEIKISNFLQILSRYERECKQIAFVHLFNSSTRVTVYAECIYVLTEYVKILSRRRHSYFLFTARPAVALPPVNCACVPQLFQQLISTVLCPAFLKTFLCQSLCCVPLQIQTFYQNPVQVAEYHVNCLQTLQ